MSSTTTTLEYNLGTMRGLGSTPRIYNFCTSDPRQSKCLDLFIRSNPTPPVKPVPGKMKTVFLLFKYINHTYSKHIFANYLFKSFTRWFLRFLFSQIN